MAETRTRSFSAEQKTQRTPPNQGLVDGWPVLHYGGIPKVDLETWSFRLFGKVDSERVFSWEQFQDLPRITLTSDFHCVTGWSRLENAWEGVPTRELLNWITPDPAAAYVMVHGLNGYTTNISIPEFLDDDCLFAFTHDGEPLSPEHGAPLRLVVPKLYAWKSAKWVTGVEFMLKDRPGFWERNGYHMHGDPWKEERYGGWR